MVKLQCNHVKMGNLIVINLNSLDLASVSISSVVTFGTFIGVEFIDGKLTLDK